VASPGAAADAVWGQTISGVAGAIGSGFQSYAQNPSMFSGGGGGTGSQYQLGGQDSIDIGGGWSYWDTDM